MAGPNKEIEDYINRELPANFSSDEIHKMYEAVVKDIVLLKKAVGMNESKMGMILQQKHKMFAFSYPVLFFKTLKGELDPVMFKNMLDIKKKLDTKEITLDQARNGVIDGAKEDIKRNPKESRPQKPKGDVQEMIVKIKADGSIKD